MNGKYSAAIGPGDYFLPPEAQEVDLQAWTDLLPGDCRVLRVTLFADIVVVDEAGVVHLLEVAAGLAEQIAQSEAEFWKRVATDEEGWQLRPLVEQCRQAGKVLHAGECYAFTTLPLFGGEYVAENVWTCPWREWFSFTGDIHVQTRDLPDGAQVEIRIID